MKIVMIILASMVLSGCTIEEKDGCFTVKSVGKVSDGKYMYTLVGKRGGFNACLISTNKYSIDSKLKLVEVK